MESRVLMLCLSLFWIPGFDVQACIWDADTLLQERFASPDMAQIILGKTMREIDPKPLQKRIQDLKSTRRETDAAWWNDLAGAHLRLGEAKVAAQLLESVTNRFQGDYGIHANLGTAYHLLGRYAEAEREIAQDLEINPEAHFGLERYHLALLQYLMRDKEYQKQHVYVDEWSKVFLDGNFRGPIYGKPDTQLPLSNTNAIDLERIQDLEDRSARAKGDNIEQALIQKAISEILAKGYTPPAYRFKWDLAGDSKFSEGIIYMAELNPNEPACYVMLGIASQRKRDLNLAAKAYERAIQLGSPQSDLLQKRMDGITSHIKEARKIMWPLFGILSLIPLIIIVFVILKIRERLKRSGRAAPV